MEERRTERWGGRRRNPERKMVILRKRNIELFLLGFPGYTACVRAYVGEGHMEVVGVADGKRKENAIVTGRGKQRARGGREGRERGKGKETAVTFTD